MIKTSNIELKDATECSIETCFEYKYYLVDLYTPCLQIIIILMIQNVLIWIIYVCASGACHFVHIFI